MDMILSRETITFESAEEARKWYKAIRKTSNMNKIAIAVDAEFYKSGYADEMDLIQTALMAHTNQCYKFLDKSNNEEEIEFLQTKIKNLKAIIETIGK